MFSLNHSYLVRYHKGLAVGLPTYPPSWKQHIEMSATQHTRRGFLKALPFGALALFGLVPRRLAGWSVFRSTDHPDPRPGIDASKVLTADQLTNPAAAPIYDMIREIPQIADGIRCNCGCADLPGYYSLLTCYEGGGMAQFCAICQGQARLAHRRVGEGQSLDQIRKAIDARFGQPSLDGIFSRRSRAEGTPRSPGAWCGDLPTG
jgi:hypothetical protein